VSSTPPSSQFLPPGTRLGSYEIVRLLGHGGMGAVYEAVHRGLKRVAAIKTLHGRFATSPEIQARFLREGQAACRVRHPNAVEVFDVGVQGDIPYLVMELLAGEDLGTLLDREKRLPAERIADILVPALAALAVAHDHGIVHRDLKPDNLFLCDRRGTGVTPKLVDFGISKVADDDAARSLTGTSDLLGTPYYMAPEQVRAARSADARSDQYSMGVLLYEAMTGRRPFEGDTMFVVMSAIVAGNYPAPRSVEPTIPEALERVIVRAMHSSPEERFRSVRELARELLPFASERTRVLYADELRPLAEAPTVVAPAPEVVPEPRTTSTLGQSASALPGRSSPPTLIRRAAWTLPLGVLLVAGGVVGTVAARRTASTPANDPTPGSPTESQVIPRTAEVVVPAASLASSGASAIAAAHTIKHVETVPTGASIEVDGQPNGVAPVEVKIPDGQATVLVEAKLTGHGSVSRELRRDDPETVVLRLTPPERPRPGTAAAAPERHAPALAPR